jgi:thiamine-monophosphate kinase
MGEFDLINRFFKRPSLLADVGIGDDCAIWTPRPGHQLAISTDMLVEGRHFLSTVDPARLGHKALAVNLSDLAACGATPKVFFLSLALPRVDPAWLADFSRGLFALADLHACELVGGDTTQGPLNISITVMGEVPAGQAVLRSGAKVGDDLYVSGHLGDARLALESFRGSISLPQTVFDAARARMETPTPRVLLGQSLCGLATSMADISDGLLGDLGHILSASDVGADIEWHACQALMSASETWPCPDRMHMTCVLSGGDDYELIFTAPPSSREAVLEAAALSATRITRIGRIVPKSQLTVRDAQGRSIAHDLHSFDHFSSR